MSEEQKKGCFYWLWRIIVGIGVVIAIPAAFSEFTGILLPDLLGSSNKTECIMPDLTGLSESVAVIQIKNMGLTPVKKNIFDQDYKKGVVISQYPVPERIIPNCEGKVIIEVSSIIERDKIIEEYPTAENYGRSNDNNGKFGFWSICLVIFAFYLIFKFLDYFT